MVKVNDQAGILIDISRNGFKLSTTAVPKSRMVDIVLTTDNRTFNLRGYTRWISRKVAAQKLYEVGINLENASPEYYKFLDELLPL